MKQVVQRKTFYMCSVCGTKYPNKKTAARCEKRTREKKAFVIGDKVRNIEPRICGLMGEVYVFSGRVVKILGPKPSDYEYEVKWLGGKEKRVNGHVYLYEIEFKCPHCKEKRNEYYYAPELQLICR